MEVLEHEDQRASETCLDAELAENFERLLFDRLRIGQRGRAVIILDVQQME